MSGITFQWRTFPCGDNQSHIRSITQWSVLLFVPCKQGPTLQDGQWKHTWLPRPAISVHHSLSWFLRPDRPRSCPALCPRSPTERQSVGDRVEYMINIKATVHMLEKKNSDFNNLLFCFVLFSLMFDLPALCNFSEWVASQCVERYDSTSHAKPTVTDYDE